MLSTLSFTYARIYTKHKSLIRKIHEINLCVRQQQQKKKEQENKNIECFCTSICLHVCRYRKRDLIVKCYTKKVETDREERKGVREKEQIGTVNLIMLSFDHIKLEQATDLSSSFNSK